MENKLPDISVDRSLLVFAVGRIIFQHLDLDVITVIFKLLIDFP